MKRFFLDKEHLESGISDTQVYTHAVNVLRMKIGDEFVAICGDAHNYLCKIGTINKNNFSFIIKSTSINTANPKKRIAVFQSLAKGEKLELITQKLTEIGISEFYPIYVKNCDVKKDSGKIPRLSKIAISACEQCGRSTPLQIFETITLKEMINLFSNYDVILFANEKEKGISLQESLKNCKSAKSIAYVIGPEGGFTDDEINAIIAAGAKSISLGSRILRTETASIYCASVICDLLRV